MADTHSMHFDPAASARYAAQAFLTEDSYKTLHKSLSTRWSDLNSLGAALRLMQAHGVQVSDEEAAHLATLDEGEQIGILVNKMPTQSNDEFQEFFVKLQLLVNTATQMREALEDGRGDDVTQALEHAEATGIAQHLLRVAIVQAGLQVINMKEELHQFSQEAGERMGRLVRGQQDARSAQRRLAQANAKLRDRGQLEVSKRLPMIANMLNRSDKVLIKMVFQEWARSHEQAAMERRVEAEFEARVKDLEDNLAAWKVSQLQGTRNVMMKQIQEANASLVFDVFAMWRDMYLEEKFERDTTDMKAQFEARMSSAKARSLELSKNIIERMLGESDELGIELALQGWHGAMVEAKEERAVKQAAMEAKERLEKQAQEQKEKARALFSTMCSGDSSAFCSCVFQAWSEAVVDAKREAELAEQLAEKSTRIGMFCSRSKASGSTAMERAAEHSQDMLLLRVMANWRKYAILECRMREHGARIDSKRQQLLSVQNMFRTFASELESGFSGKDTSRSILGSESSPGRSHHKDRSSKKISNAGPSLEKQGKSISLPSLQDASRPGSGGKKAKRPPMPQSPSGAAAR